jgi:type IV secretory pathway TrbD component
MELTIYIRLAIAIVIVLTMFIAFGLVLWIVISPAF